MWKVLPHRLREGYFTDFPAKGLDSLIPGEMEDKRSTLCVG